jgi:hypothetical protein
MANPFADWLATNPGRGAKLPGDIDASDAQRRRAMQALAGERTFNDNGKQRDWEQEFWQTDPKSAFAGFNTKAGFNPGQGDALDSWMNTFYDQLYGDYNALRARSNFQNMQFGNYLNAQRAGKGMRLPNPEKSPIGTAKPKELIKAQTRPTDVNRWRDFVMENYQNASMENKGLAYAPYEGISRWMAFG